MDTLAATEARFAATLVRDNAEAAIDAFLPGLVTGGAISPHAGIAIYRNNTKAVRLRALEQIFPVCRMVLGQPSFRALGRDHIDANPSTHPDLNEFGEGFAATLACHIAGSHDGSFDGLDYLPDLARFERLHHALNHVADDPGFDPLRFQSHATEAPERMVPEASASLRLFHSEWPVYGLWRMHVNDHPDDSQHLDDDRLVLWREGFEIRIARLPEDEFDLLEQLIGGATLAQLSTHPAAANLADFLTRRWIVGSHLV